MNRGDFVTIAMQSNLGKPRPALVSQSDQFNEHATVTVLLLSSTLANAAMLEVGRCLAEFLGIARYGHDYVNRPASRCLFTRTKARSARYQERRSHNEENSQC